MKVTNTTSVKSAPRLTFGVPVRNGERYLARALESLHAQDLSDFEVVISDNASTDSTEEIARDSARCDSRFRYFRNESDVGQIENFNRVFELSSGAYFRWLGADDHLEPAYASRCLEMLDTHPSAVGVTTLWKLIDPDGNERFREYKGPRVDSSKPRARLSRALWFLQANRLYYDPIYSMLRRDALEQTSLLQIDPWTDRLLAIELSLLGPFCHVHEILATRRDAQEPATVRLPRYHVKYRRGDSSVSHLRLAPAWTMYRGIAEVVRRWPLPSPTRRSCLALVFLYWLRAELMRPVRYTTRTLNRVKRRLRR